MKDKYREFLKKIQTGMPEPQVKMGSSKAETQRREGWEALELQKEQEHRFHELFGAVEED